MRRDPSPWPGEPELPAGVDLRGPGAFGDLLAVSDFIVLALPLTVETEDLVDDRALALMKRTAWLINVARGRLIVERALLRALAEGQLGGAVLDAFRDEPLPATSPFYDLPNVILTPHTSWSSGRVLDRSVELFAENLRRFAAGEPLLNRVDARAGY
jgi:phosphoglycerate dehydrogenase-like enzyme